MVPKGKKFFYEVFDKNGNLIRKLTSNKDTYRYAIVVYALDYRDTDPRILEKYRGKGIKAVNPFVLGFRTNYPRSFSGDDFYIYNVATIKKQGDKNEINKRIY